MHSLIVRLLLVLASAALPAVATADDRALLIDAFTKAMARGSYAMQIETEVKGRPYRTEMKVSYPDRYHMRSPDTEIIILPQGTWMNAGGQWMKVPMNMSQMIAGYSKEAMQQGMASISEVRREGSEAIDGCTADLYRYRTSGEFMGVKQASTQVAAICRDTGLPLRLVTEGKSAVTIHYDFSSEVRIAPPNG
jgi:hypothetical protein